jgi:hypothetical protein
LSPKESIVTWTVVKVGKYAGKTLPQIVFQDPDWFFWAMEKNVFGGSIPEEAREIDLRARRIRIPQKGSMVAEYVIHRPTGKFGGLKIVDPSSRMHEGSSGTFRKPYIDLSVPRTIKVYDKTGYKILLRQVKSIVFGSAKTRMTQAQCEAFFYDDHNFVLDIE